MRASRARAALVAVLTAVLVVGAAGYLAAPVRAAACTQTDPIALLYCQLGSSASVLGTPVGAPYTVGAGRGQDYTAGSIFWSSATGAHEVHGTIAVRYRELRGPAGPMGFPTSDQRTAADGVGTFNHFQGGSIFWSPSTGAWEVRGLLRDRWAALGWERGVLGYPVGGTRAAGKDGAGRSNAFQGGSIYWSAATGHGRCAACCATVAGARRGGRGARLPTLGTRATADTVGRYNHFQGGSIFWSPSTGAWEVRGVLRDRWAALGWERGVLGYR